MFEGIKQIEEDARIYYKEIFENMDIKINNAFMFSEIQTSNLQPQDFEITNFNVKSLYVARHGDSQCYFIIPHLKVLLYILIICFVIENLRFAWIYSLISLKDAGNQ